MKMIFGGGKTKLLNLRFSKLHSAKVLLELEFDTEDRVLFLFLSEPRNTHLFLD